MEVSPGFHPATCWIRTRPELAQLGVTNTQISEPCARSSQSELMPRATPWAPAPKEQQILAQGFSPGFGYDQRLALKRAADLGARHPTTACIIASTLICRREYVGKKKRAAANEVAEVASTIRIAVAISAGE